MLIIILMIVPGKVLPKIPGFLDLFSPDKLIHVLTFGIYAVLQIRGFRMQDSSLAVRRNAILYALICGFVLGAGTELLQKYYIPMRSGSVYDLIADMAGCGVGWLVIEKLKIKN